MVHVFFALQFFGMVGVILIFCLPAEAYVHLAYGSLITQVMLSGFLGLLIATRQSFSNLLINTVKRISWLDKKSS